MTSPDFLRLYPGFAVAYLLSYVYRTVNAVISPDLSAGLGITASSFVTVPDIPALRLLVFGGSFTAQWGIGLLVDAARIALGVDTAGGLRLAFALVVVIDVTAYGWRRHAVMPAAMATAIP